MSFLIFIFAMQLGISPTPKSIRAVSLMKLFFPCANIFPFLCVLQLRREEFSQPPRVCEYKLITKADVNGLSCRRGSSEKKKNGAKEQKAKLLLCKLYIEIIQKCRETWLFMFQE